MSKAPAQAAEEKTDLWMPLWIGDYLADTMSLSTAQHGAYLLLLMAYWRNRGPLKDDDDDLRSIAKADAADWPALRLKVLERFFVLDPGNVTCNVTLNVTCNVTANVAPPVWRHKRADEELAIAQANRAAQLNRGRKATAARMEKAKQDAELGCSGGGSGGSNGGAAAPSGAPDVQRDVVRDVERAGNVTLSPSPSPSPNPTGSYSVAKATAAENPPLAAALGASLDTAGLPGHAAASGAAVAPAEPPPAPTPAPTPAPARARAPAARRPSSPAPVDLPPPPVVDTKYASLTPEEKRKRDVWRAARRLLAGHVPEKRLGNVCGKLVGDFGFEVFAEAVAGATQQASAQQGLGDPIEYLTATCQRVAGERPSRAPSKQKALEDSNDAVLREWLAKRKQETIDETE